jgi:hypothetical protein
MKESFPWVENEPKKKTTEVSIFQSLSQSRSRVTHFTNVRYNFEGATSFLVVRGIRLGCCSLRNSLPLQGMVMMDGQLHVTFLRKKMLNMSWPFTNMSWLFTKNIVALDAARMLS